MIDITLGYEILFQTFNSYLLYHYFGQVWKDSDLFIGLEIKLKWKAVGNCIWNIVGVYIMMQLFQTKGLTFTYNLLPFFSCVKCLYSD